MSDERHDAVSRRAYELWEKEGGEHGRHEDHWHRAASEVDADNDGGDGNEGGDVVNVTAPDGTTMPVATAVEAAGIAQQSPGEPADAPSATPAPADDAGSSGPVGEPADSPAAATPGTPATKAKAPAKPRKPKTK